MKILILFLLVFFLSCHKDEEDIKEPTYCWDCLLTEGRRPMAEFPWVYTTTQEEYCNKTQVEINAIVNDHQYSEGMTYSSSMVCIKNE